jgi:hypothetical protein
MSFHYIRGRSEKKLKKQGHKKEKLAGKKNLENGRGV